jgi:hypothetical protein
LPDRAPPSTNSDEPVTRRLREAEQSIDIGMRRQFGSDLVERGIDIGAIVAAAAREADALQQRAAHIGRGEHAVQIRADHIARRG